MPERTHLTADDIRNEPHDPGSYGHLLLGDCDACGHSGSHILTYATDKVHCFHSGCRCNGDHADGSEQAVLFEEAGC